MKHLRVFEEYSNTYVIDSESKINGVIVAYEDDIEDMSPLHYMWNEYPRYKEIRGGFLQYSYEFYTDNKGNKYFIYGSCGRGGAFRSEIKNKIKAYDWNYARNVDEFVEGADKEEFARWKELIS